MERRYFAPATLARVEGDDAGGSVPKIVGYAATFYDPANPATEYELWPGVKERIMPGAFDEVLAGEPDTRGLYNHDDNYVLGRTTAGTMTLRVDSIGLVYEIAPPASRADVIEAIARGDVTGSSFGFIVAEEAWERNEDGLEIRKILRVNPLFDVGPVTFPAYQSTSAAVRSAADVAAARIAHERHAAEASTGRQRQVATRVRLASL